LEREVVGDPVREIERSFIDEATIGVPELDPFVDAGLITRVHATLTSGKEGTVYCCRAHPSTRRKFLAAKVYREHAASAHKWKETYFEGRERALKAQVIRAIRARTDYGKEVAASLWVSAEYETLRTLHAAGASTPEPFAQGERTVLMEYIGDGACPAPHLRGVDPDPSEAQDLFGQILDGVACMLRHHIVHGDLSPYNILVWKGRARIIDVPQAVDVRFNASALELLTRDVANVCAFFRPFGVEAEANAVTRDLWERYQRARL
jgi:RIO kinase 1